MSELNLLQFSDCQFDWDQYIRTQSGSTFCHLSAWREVMTDVLGHECLYLSAVDSDGIPRGVLPLVRVRSRVFGDYLVSMPFLNDGGPLGDADACAALTKRAVGIASYEGVDLLELRTRATPEGVATRAVNRRITVLLPLPKSPDELWNSTFRSKLRNKIRRPIKAGLAFRTGIKQLEPFYEIFARNMRDLGTPVLPKSFFERISKLMRDTVVFAAVYQGDQPVAAGCGFAWKEEFEITWSSTIRTHNHLHPNMLLYKGLMEHAIERGVAVFNFGRCVPGGNTHEFKSQWGGYDLPLPWAQWSVSDIDSTPSPERPLFQVATAVWQRLPLWVANRLGPTLSRQIP